MPLSFRREWPVSEEVDGGFGSVVTFRVLEKPTFAAIAVD